MGSLVNCKPVTSSTITVNKSQQVGGSATITLEIEPINSSYVVAAENFSYNHDSNNNAFIDNSPAITGSDTSTAYAAGNKVRFVFDLVDSFTPSESQDLTVDLSGSATHLNRIPYKWTGEYAWNVTNCSQPPSGVNNTVFTQPNPGAFILNSGSNTDNMGNTVNSHTVDALLTLDFVADTGHFFDTEPSYVLSNASGFDSMYVIEKQVTAENANGQPTRYRTKWRIENFTADADIGQGTGLIPTKPRLTWTATATADNATPANEIRSLVTDTSNIDAAGETREIRIYGSQSNSKFDLEIKDDAGSPNTYDFTTNTFTSAATTLNSSGTEVGDDLVHVVNVVIPADSAGATYTVKVTGVSPTGVSSSITNYNNSNPTLTWTQSAQAVFLINAISDDQTLTKTYSNNSLNVTINLEEQEGYLYQLEPFTINAQHASKNLFIRRTPIFSNTVAFNEDNSATPAPTMNDFTNTRTADAGNDAYDWYITKLETSGNGTQTVTVTGCAYIYTTGAASLTSTLELDNFINQPPVTTNKSGVNVAHNTALAINLASNITDPEGDPTTLTVVSSPSNGSTSVSGSVVTYTPTTNSSGADSFTYKVNDGYEDSNTSTVSLTTASSGGGGLSSELCYQIEVHNSSGATGSVHYVSPTIMCDAGSLATLAINLGSNTNRFVKFSTVGGGCGSTHHGIGKITSTTNNQVPTAYVFTNCHYSNYNLNDQQCL